VKVEFITKYVVFTENANIYNPPEELIADLNGVTSEWNLISQTHKHFPRTVGLSVVVQFGSSEDHAMFVLKHGNAYCG